MRDVLIGARAEAAITVEQANTASAMGSGNVPVFATPAMVTLMERAAVRALERFLDEGETSVGAGHNIRHTSPIPIGRRVRAEARVQSVDGRRVVFDVRAYDSAEEVGAGTHERVVVDRDAFIWKAASKAMPKLGE